LDRVEPLAAITVACRTRPRVNGDDDDHRGVRGPPLAQRLGKPLARLDRAHDGEAPRLDVAGGRGEHGRIEQRANVLVGDVELGIEMAHTAPLRDDFGELH